MAFAAKYPGTCADCGKGFPAGTMINYSAGRASHAKSCKFAGGPARICPECESPIWRGTHCRDCGLIGLLTTRGRS